MLPPFRGPRPSRVQTAPSLLSSADSPARPPLKRQSTAPAYTRVESPKRIRVLDDVDQDIWSDDVHAAFLEALHTRPPTRARFSQARCENDSEDREQDAFSELIQAHIFRKTGKFETVQRISNHMAETLSEAPHTSPPYQHACLEVQHPRQETIARIDPSLALAASLSDPDLLPTSYISQLHGSPIPNIRSHSATHSSASLFPSAKHPSSMSRRRQASNRPTLNLQVDIPPPSINLPLPRFLRNTSVASSSKVAPSPTSSATTPSLWRPPVLSRTSSSSLNSNPQTPAEQRIQTPLAPPEIPRMTHTRHSGMGRHWTPTPTEGVLPAVSYETVTTTTSSGICTDTVDSVESSNGEIPTCLPPTSLSWLTKHALVASTSAPDWPYEMDVDRDGGALASPLMISPLYNPFVPRASSLLLPGRIVPERVISNVVPSQDDAFA